VQWFLDISCRPAVILDCAAVFKPIGLLPQITLSCNVFRPISLYSLRLDCRAVISRHFLPSCGDSGLFCGCPVVFRQTAYWCQVKMRVDWSQRLCQINLLHKLEVGRYCHDRFRYFWPKMSAISISIYFTAVLLGLLKYFIIASKVVNDVNVIF